MNWIDNTREISIDSYNRIKDAYFDKFRESPGVINYGTFGSVQSPGLSDLDLIVIVEDKILVDKKFKIEQWSNNDKYILHHSPMIVPQSLVEYLPYYHYIKVNLENGDIDNILNNTKDSDNLKCLHVINKTIYLQSRLWDILLQKSPKCRPAFLTLVSVARSIQFCDKNIDNNEVYNKYVNDILQLREEWIQNPHKRKLQIIELQRLFYQALNISIKLVEELSNNLLKIKKYPGDRPKKIRGLQTSPMNYILEITNIENLGHKEFIKYNIKHINLLKNIGKLRFPLFGKFALVGSTTISIVEHEYNAEKIFNINNNCCKWGDLCENDIKILIKREIGNLISKKIEINSKFAEILLESNLSDANFGSIWIMPGYRGFIYKSLGNTLGRIRLLRFLHASTEYNFNLQ